MNIIDLETVNWHKSKNQSLQMFKKKRKSNDV